MKRMGGWDNGRGDPWDLLVMKAREFIAMPHFWVRSARPVE